MDPLWPRDVTILWRRPMEFFPTRDQSPEERVNALVRFTLYAAAAIALFGSPSPVKSLAVGVAVACVITMISSADLPRKKTALKKRASGSDRRDDAGKQATACRKPTPDNPFMNVPPTSFGEELAPACRYADVKADVKDNFESGLVREVTDVYHNRASDRQFITMPVSNGIPDTQAFRNFLFSNVARRDPTEPKDWQGVARH